MKQIVMIGKPLSHVRSPYLLRDLIRADGLNIAVETEELGPEDLPLFMASLRQRPDVLGLIVTTPLKSVACDYADDLTADAVFIGASNCLRRDGTRWIGANFDGYGFARAISSIIGDDARRRVLLIGCGAAGSAIATSLVANAAMELTIVDRDMAKATAFAARLQEFAPGSHVAAASEPVVAPIVINASTAGMEDDDRSPVPAHVVEGATVIGDIMVRETALKRAARRHGKTLIDGDAMVRGQAIFLYRFLTGKARSEPEVLARCGGTD